LQYAKPSKRSASLWSHRQPFPIVRVARYPDGILNWAQRSTFLPLIQNYAHA